MELEKLLAAQRSRVAEGIGRVALDRLQALEALWQGMEKHETELLDALHHDLGKNRIEAFASELSMVRAEIRLARRNLSKWMRPEKRPVPGIAWPGRAEVHPDPCGSVLIIGPWNYPVQLLLAPLVGVLASGSSAVLKPSELAPATALAIAALVSECFSPETVAVVQGGAEVAAGLANLPFDHIFFTGGEVAGRKVLAAAANHLTPTTLELGGKCPALVAPSGRSAKDTRRLLEVAAKRIAWGKYLNAGQTCVAPDFVLVDHRYRDDLVALLSDAYQSFGLSDHARIINQRHFERLSGYLREGSIAYGGGGDSSSLRMDPTILVDLPESSAVLEEEIFGPILPIVACDSLESAVVRARQLPPPLAIYVFTDDPQIAREVTRRTVSGGVCINDTVVQAAAASLPFGGVGRSGMGRYHGKASFDTFVRPRTIVSRPLRPDFAFRYPPVKLSFESFRRLSRFFS